MHFSELPSPVDEEFLTKHAKKYPNVYSSCIVDVVQKAISQGGPLGSAILVEASFAIVED